VTDYFVTLTGSKSNAGDHLIRHRAHALLRWQRPDREIADIDGWRPLGDAELEKVNGAKALILCGGPALQRRMVPKIYNLPALDRIKVPIVSLGIGWKSKNGAWRDTAGYPFDPRSAELLERMDRSGCGSSVRDYHSLVMLERRGLTHFINTGCPALYERETLDAAAAPAPLREPRSIGFSLGVAHRESRSMAAQSRALLLALRARYPGARLTVAFHHPPADWPGDARFARWLDGEGVRYEDISGSHERLMSFYRECDLHVGYRVHAHLYRTSLNRASVLITEDGRGRAQQAMLGGTVLDGYDSASRGWATSLGRRAGLADPFRATADLDAQLLALLGHLAWFQGAREAAWDCVRRHFVLMRAFLGALP
jgi:hypothetical protein